MSCPHLTVMRMSTNGEPVWKCRECFKEFFTDPECTCTHELNDPFCKAHVDEELDCYTKAEVDERIDSIFTVLQESVTNRLMFDEAAGRLKELRRRYLS